jgi:hypothetical protein
MGYNDFLLSMHGFAPSLPEDRDPKNLDRGFRGIAKPITAP